MAFSLSLMCARVYFVERDGWTLVVYCGARRGVYLGVGWSLPMSELDPFARIYLDEMVGHSSLSAWSHFTGAPTVYLGQGRLDS